MIRVYIELTSVSTHLVDHRQQSMKMHTEFTLMYNEFYMTGSFLFYVEERVTFKIIL